MNRKILVIIFAVLAFASTGGSTTRTRKRVQREEKALHLAWQSGLDQLPATLTINGISKKPAARYRGQDATATTWPAWVYGAGLTISGAGAAPTLEQPTPLVGDDQSVKFQGGKYFDNSNTTFLNTGTSDIVVEFVVKAPSTAGYVFVKRGGASYIGYGLYWNGTAWEFLVDDGPTTKVVNVSGVSGGWYHIFCAVDKSGAMIAYSNASPGAPTDISSLGSLDNPGVASIGSREGTLVYTDNILYIAVWSGANWLDTHLQSAVAAERFAHLNGTYAAVNRGASKIPTFTRATTATLKKWNGTSYDSFIVGAGWPRVERWVDASGGIITGYHAEAGDVLQYSISSLTGYTAEASFLCDGIPGASGILVSGGNAAEPTERATMAIDTSSAILESVKVGGSSGSASVNGTPTDNAIHTLRAHFREDKVRAKYDATVSSVDTDADIPEITRLDVGHLGSSLQPGGLIGPIKIYK